MRALAAALQSRALDHDAVADGLAAVAAVADAVAARCGPLDEGDEAWRLIGRLHEGGR